MPFDKTQPRGENAIAQGDDEIRANNEGLEDAIGAEHDFSTGGTQSGRHKFAIGTNSAITTMVGPVDGTIGYVTDARTGFVVPMIRNSGVWEYQDIHQPASLPRLNEQTVFSVCQFSDVEIVIPSSGTPDVATIDLAESAHKYIAISGDTLIQNPTNAVANKGVTFRIDVIQGAGSSVLTWGDKYATVGGAMPPLASGLSELTSYTVTWTALDTFLVSAAADVRVIA